MYFARPAPDPASFGIPAGTTAPVTTRCVGPVGGDHRLPPDVPRWAAAPTRVVIAVGEESLVVTGRAAAATAGLLGQQATVFPSHHGGFLGGEFGYAGQPEAFAARLREVLAD